MLSCRSGTKLVGLRKAGEEANLNGFYKIFCKIDSFCSNGEPNLLGWAVIVIVGLILLYLVLKFFGIVREPD